MRGRLFVVLDDSAAGAVGARGAVWCRAAEEEEGVKGIDARYDADAVVNIELHQQVPQGKRVLSRKTYDFESRCGPDRSLVVLPMAGHNATWTPQEADKSTARDRSKRTLHTKLYQAPRIRGRAHPRHNRASHSTSPSPRRAHPNIA